MFCYRVVDDCIVKREFTTDNTSLFNACKEATRNWVLLQDEAEFNSWIKTKVR